MNGSMEETVGTGPLTVYCGSCGGAMRVAPAHAHLAVACPHCGGRVLPTAHAGGSPPPLPPTQQPGMTPPTQTPGTQAPGMVPPMSPYGQMSADGYSWRNRWVAGALGILLGTFGVQRFYLGHTKMGILMLILGAVSFGIISSIWGFIDGILCFCGAMRDEDGLPLRG